LQLADLEAKVRECQELLALLQAENEELKTKSSALETAVSAR
jgi:FtsZ-binding cell division protein ZapB